MNQPMTIATMFDLYVQERVNLAVSGILSRLEALELRVQGIETAPFGKEAFLGLDKRVAALEDGPTSIASVNFRSQLNEHLHDALCNTDLLEYIEPRHMAGHIDRQLYDAVDERLGSSDAIEDAVKQYLDDNTDDVAREIARSVLDDDDFEEKVKDLVNETINNADFSITVQAR